MQMARALVLGAVAILAGPALALDLPANTDPAFADSWTACFSAIEAGGVLDESLGWTTHDSGNPDALMWENSTSGFATKDLAGVGLLSLSVTVQNYSGHWLGTCKVRIENPEREIDGPALKSQGFPGTLQGDAGAWYGAWRDEAATLFVNALYSEESEFELSMTRLMVAQ